MDYSTSPATDADRHLTARDTFSEDRARAEALMADEFLAAARANRVDAPALFAARVPDRNAPKMTNGQHIKRYQTVAEVMAESLDNGAGPQMSDVMALVCRVAKGEIQTAAARELLNRMAVAFARHNAEVVS